MTGSVNPVDWRCSASSFSRGISTLRAREGTEGGAPGKDSSEHPDLKGRANVNLREIQGGMRCKGYMLPQSPTFLFEGKFWGGHVCIRTGLVL